MRARQSPLLLVLTSTLCAQMEAPRSSAPTVAQAPKLRRAISIRNLLIPPKAVKEIQRSQRALLSGDLTSSALHLEKALQIYPHYLEGHNNLGNRYIELREYEKAVVQFQKAIDLNPRIMEPFSNLSVALFLLQRYPEAEAAARRALDLDPRNSTSRYMLGCILAMDKRNASEAIEVLRQTQSEFPDSRLLLAKVLIRQGAVTEAEQELREYLEVPGIEKKERVECWLARLTQTSAATKSATQTNTP